MSRANESSDLNSLLFGGETSLVNLKCFVGDGKPSEEALRDALASALRQRREGTALVSKKFNDDAPKVDVRALVAAG